MRHFRLLDPNATTAPDLEILLLAAASDNGYERQEAVRWLAERESGEELRPLLKRANDWVPQVRHAAQSALIARLTPKYAYRLACVLDEIESLQRMGRDSHAGFVSRVQALLVSPEGESGLLHACHYAPSPAQQYCRLLALRRLPGTRGAHWLEESLNDLDWLRRLAARQARTEATAEQLVGWTLKQSVRPPASIAQELLYGLVERFPGAAPPVLETLLLSPYTALRRTAQFYAKAHLSVTDYYQARIPEPLALQGWAEGGGTVELLVPYLHDSCRAVRRAALGAVATREPEHFKPDLLAALADPEIGATRAVVAALSKVLRGEDEPTVQAALITAPAAHRRRLLRLLTALPHWSVPAALLTAAPTETGTVLEHWLRTRVQFWPSPTQLARLEAAVPACPEPLRPRFQETLQHAQRYVLR